MSNILDRMKEINETFDKLNEERLEFAYDSLCLRVFELANECAALKATHPATTDYRGDLAYWKRHYGRRACRFVEIFDRLMQGNHHPKKEKD